MISRVIVGLGQAGLKSVRNSSASRKSGDKQREENSGRGEEVITVIWEGIESQEWQRAVGPGKKARKNGWRLLAHWHDMCECL